MKLLILPHKDYFYNQYSEYVGAHYMFKEINSKIFLILRRIHFKFFPFLYSIWFPDSLKKIDFKVIDKIIVFDSLYSIDIANYLKRKHPWVEVSIYYRNHMEDPSEIKKARHDIRIWSYDNVDCDNYGLKYNPQFYFTTLATMNTNEVSDLDFFFIGQIKGRISIIEEVQESLTKLDFKLYFHVIDEKNKKSPDYKYLDYKDVVGMIKRSKCVVDIVGDWQTGMTLRPLEALFNRKKLLTNFKNIKGFDFYNPQNIFIYGYDDLKRLETFINTPFDDSSVKFIEEYDFSSWLTRF